MVFGSVTFTVNFPSASVTVPRTTPCPSVPFSFTFTVAPGKGSPSSSTTFPFTVISFFTFSSAPNRIIVLSLIRNEIPVPFRQASNTVSIADCFTCRVIFFTPMIMPSLKKKVKSDWRFTCSMNCAKLPLSKLISSLTCCACTVPKDGTS